MELVKSWPRPLSSTDIRSFLGLAGYYRRFVVRLSSIKSPLTSLKDRLNSALVLTLAEGTEGFMVYCDASRVGLGYALMEHGIYLKETQSS